MAGIGDMDMGLAVLLVIRIEHAHNNIEKPRKFWHCKRRIPRSARTIPNLRTPVNEKHQNTKNAEA